MTIISFKAFFFFFEAVPNMGVKKSDIVKAVIVRTLKGIRRESGMTIRFDDNAVVIINADFSPRGTFWILKIVELLK